MEINIDGKNPKELTDFDIDQIYRQLENKCITEIPLICEQYNINIDIDNTIKPRQFQFVLRMLSRQFIQPNVVILLKDPNGTGGKYDLAKVDRLYNIYILLAENYNQAINIINFLVFSNIDHQSLYNWSHEISAQHFDFLKRLKRDNEASLEQLLLDKSINPMKVLPILNHRHGWDKDNVRGEQTVNALTVENLPALGIEQNDDGGES